MLTDREKLKHALRHPTRRLVLREIGRAGITVASASELASVMELPLSEVNYHVQVLASLEALREADGETVTGRPGRTYSLNIDCEEDQVRDILDEVENERPDGSL